MNSLEKIIGIIVAAIALIRKLDGENKALEKALADLQAKTSMEEALLNQHITELEAALSAVAPVGSTGGIGG